MLCPPYSPIRERCSRYYCRLQIHLNNLETLYLKMSSKILDILAKRHNEWLNMAKSFKLNNSDANELVQEMYLRMYDYTKDVKRIMYNETEINTFYIYITLRNLYYSKFTNYNKNKKTVLFSDIDTEKFNYIMNQIVYDVDEYNDNYKKKVNLEALYNKIEDVIEEWYWYDKKQTKEQYKKYKS